MLRKALLGLVAVGVVLAGAGAVLYVTNEPPVVPAISEAELADSRRPYVVKLHAQWCPVCMVTKDVWSEIEQAYAGRVNLVVLDFTTKADFDASAAEVARLKLQSVYDEYFGATGVIVVVDGRTRKITAAIDGSRDFTEYREAIDAVLARTARLN